MNKDDHSSLTLSDRFLLFLSQPAIEREIQRIKRPVVSVEVLTSFS
jgi:hypothetical protein